ncbi:MAG: hypothetical protein U9Q12_01315 [Patescibacteria group bacterium]|nr:hypothetical protein [Patescibacteria group bacterium]
METFFVVMFWLLLFDSVGANIVSWFGLTKWYHNFTVISRLFPATKGWTTYYFVLVLFIGFILKYFGIRLIS